MKHVYYLGWNRSPAQAACMRQVLGPHALGRPRGIGWRGRWEGGSGWGIHVNPWLIHVNVWKKPLQYCKVISLQLIKINEKKKGNCSDLYKRVHGLCFLQDILWFSVYIWPLIRFEFTFVYSVRKCSNFFLLFITSSFPNTTYWRDCLFLIFIFVYFVIDNWLYLHRFISRLSVLFLDLGVCFCSTILMFWLL